MMMTSEEKLIETLTSIYTILNNLQYECSARVYTLDEDEMGWIFHCRNSAWIALQQYKIKIPQQTPSFEEISKQMRINADILKKEITDHVDNEIERLKKVF